MRLGDHMMLIQLQLSTVNASSSNKRNRTSTVSSAKPSGNCPTATTSTYSTATTLPPCCRNKPPVSSPITQSSTSSRSRVSSEINNSASERISTENPPILTNPVSSVTPSLSTDHLKTFNTTSKSAPSSTNVKCSQPSTKHFKTVPCTTSATAQPTLIASNPPVQGNLNGNTKSTYKPKLDTRALAEASKNLTQTLKQLSSEVLTTKSEEVRYIN